MSVECLQHPSVPRASSAMFPVENYWLAGVFHLKINNVARYRTDS